MTDEQFLLMKIEVIVSDVYKHRENVKNVIDNDIHDSDLSRMVRLYMNLTLVLSKLKVAVKAMQETIKENK